MAIETLSDDASALNLEQDRQTAIAKAYAEIARRPVYLDTETTGLEKEDEILEICILDSDGSLLFESLVKPRGSISEGPDWVHRITKRMVKDAPSWEQVLPHVGAALAGRRVAIYNADFDVRMLIQSTELSNLPWEVDERASFCIMKLYARFYGKIIEGGTEYRWQGLGRAARHCGIAHGKTHRAQADAQLARLILKHMASHYVVYPPKAMLPRRRMPLIQRWLARSRLVSRESCVSPVLTCCEHTSAYTPRRLGQQEDEMDEFFLQLSELARAGWSLQIYPEPDAPTLPAVRAVILWSYERNPDDPMPYEPRVFPLIDWINLLAPETEMRKAVAKMHERIFPIPPFGNVAA